MTYAKLRLALGILVAVMLAGSAVTVALADEVTKPSSPAARGQSVTKTNLLISSEFISVPDDLMKSLDISWRPSDSGGATAILTQQQHTNIAGALHRNENATALGQLRIESGQSVEGSVSLINGVKVAGTNTQTGIFLTVTGSLSVESKSADLILTPEWRELVDLSPQHDGSQNTIRTTKGTTETTLTLNAGQTILIRQPVIGSELIPGGKAGTSKNLLVFVTPQLSYKEKIYKLIPVH